MEINRILLSLVKLVALATSVLIASFMAVILLLLSEPKNPTNIEVRQPLANSSVLPKVWELPKSSMTQDEQYGKDLIAHTAEYFGPNGTLSKSTNGLNCQNCHLEQGTKSYGNNFARVATEYPKFRARSGKVETISSRVNDCFERSLDGKALDTNSREMKSMVAYIKWVGKNVPKDEKLEGLGMAELAFLDRKADLKLGKVVYVNKCQICHGENGAGKLNGSGVEFEYPPLWGEHSFNDAAGLYRLSRMASFVYDNMPMGVRHGGNLLSAEEAWDVAAFVNSMPRPHKVFLKDWPDISKKPIDHPFGPFSDGFSEEQHKYGPFKPIANAKTK